MQLNFQGHTVWNFVMWKKAVLIICGTSMEWDHSLFGECQAVNGITCSVPVTHHTGEEGKRSNLTACPFGLSFFSSPWLPHNWSILAQVILKSFFSPHLYCHFPYSRPLQYSLVSWSHSSMLLMCLSAKPFSVITLRILTAGALVWLTQLSV